jgi:hypothetical protein
MISKNDKVIGAGFGEGEVFALSIDISAVFPVRFFSSFFVVSGVYNAEEKLRGKADKRWA